MDKREAWEVDLDIAHDQLVLSIQLRGIFWAGAGKFKSTIDAVSKGPWYITREEMDAIDYHKASWGIECICTNHLAIVLDTEVQKIFPTEVRKRQDPRIRDFISFVRCLRNAFAHNPYDPSWDLKDEAYRRLYTLPNEWKIDLTNKHGEKVEQSDYKYAGGLLKLIALGKEIIREELSKRTSARHARDSSA